MGKARQERLSSPTYNNSYELRFDSIPSGSVKQSSEETNMEVRPVSSAEPQLRFQNVPLLTNDQWSALPSRGRSRPELGVPAGLWRGSPLYDGKLARLSRVPQGGKVPTPTPSQPGTDEPHLTLCVPAPRAFRCCAPVVHVHNREGRHTAPARPFLFSCQPCGFCIPSYRIVP